MKGKFITFEGGEGSGKTTQISLLAETLGEHGIPLVQAREPGGTPGAELIRRVVKDGDKDTWDGLSEALLMYAARHDLTEKVIKPALRQGTWVLCDRFFDSTYVFQGVARGVGTQKIKALQHLVLDDFEPDLTFYFDLPPAEGLRRAARRPPSPHGTDRFEEAGLSFHEKVHDAYQDLARNDPRFEIIQAGDSVEEIRKKLWSLILKRFLT